MKLHARPLALLTVGLLSASSAGCSKKGPECQAMVGVINPTSDAMVRATSSKAESGAEQAEAMRKLATVTKNASDAMGKLTVTVPELKKVQTDYRALYTKASSDAASLADTIAAIGVAEKEMEKLGLALKASIDGWGEACSAEKNKPDAAGCLAFAEAMKTLPKDPTNKPSVERSLLAMDKIEWKSDELRASAKKVRDAYAASTAHVAAMHALGVKAEAADKGFKEVEGKEQTLIDGFNKFCKQLALAGGVWSEEARPSRLTRAPALARLPPMSPLPRIILSRFDRERLESLLYSVGERPDLDALREELERAEIVEPADVPANVVTMNSRVRFVDESTKKESEVTLVFPNQADADSRRISVLAPIGSALLGLAVGATIDWPLPGSRTRKLRVVAVTYQPEAAGDPI